MPQTMKFYKVITHVFAGLLIVFISACNNEDITRITSIELRHPGQPSELFAGSTFVFQVMADNGTDVTGESTIKVDGNAIEGNTFTTSDEPAEYIVTATYQGIESDPVTVTTGNGFTKNVLVEDYTGTWCGWCPRVAYAILLAKEASGNVVAVAVHQNSSSEPDPFVFDGSTELGETFGVYGLPQGRIDRIHVWTAPEPEHVDEVLAHTGFSPFGIALSSQFADDEIDVNVRVNFASDPSVPLNVVVYLLESGLVYDQTNYTQGYFSEGYENPLQDFVHNDVLRAVFTPVLGDPIPGELAYAGNIYSYGFTAQIPSSVESNEHLSLVAFVTNANTGEVLNVREAAVGEEQDFQTGE